MERLFEEIIPTGLLDNGAKVHNGDFIAHMLHNTHVMGNEKIGQIELTLKFPQQIKNLGLDRHVEGRNRFIAYDQIGLASQSPGNDDALTLTA